MISTEDQEDVRWLSQLQNACERGDTWSRLQTCVAASEICGGNYPDPDRFWFDALQDLTVKQRELRREDPNNWSRQDGEFFDRVNHAIRRWEQRVAQPEEDETMTTTTRTRKTARVKRKAEPPTEDRLPLVDRLLDLADAYDPSLLSLGIVNPTDVDGQIFATTAVERSRKRLVATEIYSMILMDDFTGTLATGSPQERFLDPMGMRHGTVVRVDKTKYVLQGPPLYVDENGVTELAERGQIPETQSGAQAKEEAVDNPSDDDEFANYAPAAPPDREPIHELAPHTITAAPWNPRQHFDAAAIKDLAASIKKVGLLQPIVVRRNPRDEPEFYELVAGERRWRAAKHAKVETILARVVELTDEEAKEACVVENLKRQDLNPIEKARSVKLLIDGCGLTQEQAAKRLGYGNASMVANELFLLELPEAWQQRIVSQEISPTHARHLRTWIDRENVLDQVVTLLGNEVETPPADDFKWLVADAARDCSRSISKTAGRGSCEFVLTSKRRKELDIQKVPRQFGQPVPRAFNVELWEQLNKEARAKKKASQKSTQAVNADAKLTAKKTEAAKPTSPDKRSAQWSKVRWYQSAIAKRIETTVLDELLPIMLAFSPTYAFADDGLNALRVELSGQPKATHGMPSPEVMWPLVVTQDCDRLFEALRSSIAKSFGPLEDKDGESIVNRESVDDLSTLRAMAEWLRIDFASEWIPCTEDLREYSDAKLRKMPLGKEAPEDLSGEELAGWMAMRWQAGEYIPREFKEPKRKAT